MKRLAIVILLLALAPAARADDRTDMAAAANRFYAAYNALPRQGGLPGPAARARLRPLLTPRLAGLIDQAAAADARFHAKVKDAPPLFDGDLFSSQFEGFQTYRIGACSPGTGRCTVQLHDQQPGRKAVDWSDEVVLARTPAGWKVDDIAYKGAPDLGNSGLLSQTLAMAIAAAP